MEKVDEAKKMEKKTLPSIESVMDKIDKLRSSLLQSEREGSLVVQGEPDCAAPTTAAVSFDGEDKSDCKQSETLSNNLDIQAELEESQQESAAAHDNQK